MYVDVLSVEVKAVGQNKVRIAYCRAGKAYGEIVANPKVTGPCRGVVKVTGVAHGGRFVFKGVVHPA